MEVELDLGFGFRVHLAVEVKARVRVNVKGVGGRHGNEKAKRTNMPSHGGCYGLNCVPTNSDLGALTPCNSECDGIWRQGLKRGDQFKTVIKMGPNPI